MAVRSYTKIETQWQGIPTVLYRWTGLLQGDTGAPARIPAHADVTVQARGTPGAGGTILFEGTLDDAVVPGSNSYGSLHKTDQSLASISVAGGIIQILEHPLQIRPNESSGDGSTNWTVDVLVGKQWKD